jgi:hypothetical protein
MVIRETPAVVSGVVRGAAPPYAGAAPSDPVSPDSQDPFGAITIRKVHPKFLSNHVSEMPPVGSKDGDANRKVPRALEGACQG